MKESKPTRKLKGQLRRDFELSILSAALLRRTIAPDKLERRVNKLSKINQRKTS